MRKQFTIFTVAAVLWGSIGCKEEHSPMLEQLEALEQANRADEPMTNDSLALQLVEHFDRHGNSNERMRARYMLGRTYADLGELPRALETYFEASECADTTDRDCNFAVLSRIHAQAAMVYYEQVQPRSQLEELRRAEYYARRAKDTLQAIECHTQQGDAYSYLKMTDSVIYIKEEAARMFKKFRREDRAAQSIGSMINPLINKGETAKAKEYCELYETKSGFFDDEGNIEKGREVYYYAKGNYYLAAGKVDSAEYMFRRELSTGKDINNQIGGSKGLQLVYEKLKKPDSIAKYANMSYELNDSVYLLSEMENIQKLKASYNYNHNKLLAEQKAREAEQTWYALLTVAATAVIAALAALLAFSRYRARKVRKVAEYRKHLENLETMQSELMEICSEKGMTPEEIFARKSKDITEQLQRISEFKATVRKTGGTLEERLCNSRIVTRLREKTKTSPYVVASSAEMKELRNLINEEIPQFYTTLNTPSHTLRQPEYDISLLVRVHFSPSEIQKLTGTTSAYVTNTRTRLLKKVFGEDGKASDYDERLFGI